MYSLTDLEAKSVTSVSLGLNQGVSREKRPPEALGESPFFLPPAPGGCQQALTCGHITLHSSFLLTFFVSPIEPELFKCVDLPLSACMTQFGP